MLFLQLGLGLMSIAGSICFVAAGQQWVAAVSHNPGSAGSSHHKQAYEDCFERAIAAVTAAGVFLGIVIVVGGIVAACGS